MVNRTMQQKMIKIKKQRRAWARPLQVKSGIRPNFDVIRQYKQSAKGLAMSDEQADALYRRLFKRDPWKGNGPARLEVLKLLVEMKDKTPDYLFFSILDSNTLRVRVYFDSLKTTFYIVEEDFTYGVVRRSILYSTKERAISVWHTSSVAWVEKRILPDPIPDS